MFLDLPSQTDCMPEQMIRILLPIALIIILPLSSAYANPIPMGKGETAFVGLFFFLAILSEVAVTLFLLKKYRLRLKRLGLVYLAVNLFSFVLFVGWILPNFHNLGLFFPIPDVLAEMFVIILETAILLMLVNLLWFRNENSKEVPICSALLAVTAGNLTSVLFGFLILLPSVFAFFNFLRH
jgi:hypothetical protein